MYTNAISASEHDYSSSSEQSCDTVIFMPRNNEFTEEFPQYMSSLGMSTPPHGYQRSTPGDSSDPESVSSGGHRSVPKCGATMSKAAKIRSAAAAGKTYTSTSESTNKKYVKRTLVEQSEPALKSAWSKSSYREVVNQKECWIDGPAATTEDSPKRPAEHWVDGPPEFQLIQQVPSPAQRRKKMWTEMQPKPDPPPRGVSLGVHPSTSSPAPYTVDHPRANYSDPNQAENRYADGRLQMVYGCVKTYGATPAAISAIVCDPCHGTMKDVHTSVSVSGTPTSTPAANLPGADHHHRKIEPTSHHGSSPVRNAHISDTRRTPSQQRKSADMDSTHNHHRREGVASPRLTHRTSVTRITSHYESLGNTPCRHNCTNTVCHTHLRFASRHT